MLTVKTLAYALAAAVAVAGVTSLRGCVLSARLDAARAKVDAVAADRDRIAADLVYAKSANSATLLARDKALSALAQCNAENLRLADAGAAAIRKADAERQDAERTLAEYMARYAVSAQEADCARARETMGRACSALADY